MSVSFCQLVAVTGGVTTSTTASGRNGQQVQCCDKVCCTASADADPANANIACCRLTSGGSGFVMNAFIRTSATGPFDLGPTPGDPATIPTVTIINGTVATAAQATAPVACVPNVNGAFCTAVVATTAVAVSGTPATVPASTLTCCDSFVSTSVCCPATITSTTSPCCRGNTGPNNPTGTFTTSLKLVPMPIPPNGVMVDYANVLANTRIDTWSPGVCAGPTIQSNYVISPTPAQTTTANPNLPAFGAAAAVGAGLLAAGVGLGAAGLAGAAGAGAGAGGAGLAGLGAAGTGLAGTGRKRRSAASSRAMAMDVATARILTMIHRANKKYDDKSNN